VTGWLLILAVLVLGGVLSTLGDRLGSRIGKARLSLFRLRPRKTAVLITVLTGSLISALTLGLIVAVSERLRVGLFQLDQLESRLRNSKQALQASVGQLGRSEAELGVARQERQQADLQRQRATQGLGIAQQRLSDVEVRAQKLRAELAPLQQRRRELEAQRDKLSGERDRLGADVRVRDAELQQLQQRTAMGQKELKQLETKVLALRSGDVVLSSGQPLTMAKVAIPRPALATQAAEDVLREANLRAFDQVLPGQPANRQLLLIPRSEVAKVEKALRSGGTWVVSIRSAGNVLRGENQVLAFADVRPNQRVVNQGQLLASVSLDSSERGPEQVRARLNLLLAAAQTESLRQGSLAPTIQFDMESFNDLGRRLSERQGRQPLVLQVVSSRDSDTSDPIVVELRGVGFSNE
jgi:uncharacterized protein (DUF3084 family)